jgi:hypothetical protein
MLTSQVHIEHAGRIGNDVGRLGDRGLDIAIGHASLRRGELLAAQEQPRRGVCIAGEGLGIGDQPPVVREICRTFEFSHPYKVSRKSSAARCPKDTIIPTGASPFSDAVTRMTPDRSPESQVDAVVDSYNLGASGCSMPSLRFCARAAGSSSLRNGTLIAAVCPGLIDTAASRPWFTDMSPHSLPDCVQSSDIV